MKIRWKHFKLQSKFLLAFGLAIAVTSSLITYYFIREQNAIISQSIEEKASTLLTSTAINLEYNIKDIDSPKTNQILQNILLEKNAVMASIISPEHMYIKRISITDAQRLAIPREFLFSLIPGNFDNINNRYTAHLERQPLFISIFYARPLKNILHVAMPLYMRTEKGGSGRKQIGYLVISTSLNQMIQKEFSTLITVLGLTAGIAMAIFLCCYLFVDIIIQRLTQLKESTFLISQGHYNHRTKIKVKDELGDLGENFNRMAQEIESYATKLNDYSKKLEEKVKQRTLALEEKNITLELALEKAQESERLKTEFLTNMSHELRTPLNAVIGFSDILIQGIDGELNDMQAHDIELINNSGKHLLNLINGILDLAKIDAGKMEIRYENVQVTDIIDNVIQISRALIQNKELELKFEINKDVPEIEVDKMKFKQILLNLLSNAIKFTENGFVQILAQKQDEHILFAVQDTGIGIPQSDYNKVFERFRQLDGTLTRKSGGTGLGMALVKDLIELHKGKIWIESEVGKGTIFYFTLPIKFQSATKSEDTDKQDADKHRILVVDDEENNIFLMTRYLNSSGYISKSIRNGNTIIQDVLDFNPHIILLDIMLPGKDGWEVLKELKNNDSTKHIPVIICTVIEHQDQNKLSGVSDYLIKPLDKTDLLKSLKTILNKTKKILVVEDSQFDQAILKKMLDQMEYLEIRMTADPQESLKIISDFKPDLVILDLLMPSYSGFELLEMIRKMQEGKDVPVIVMSGKTLNEEEKMLLHSNSNHIFTKGMFTTEELTTHLSNVFGREVNKNTKTA